MSLDSSRANERINMSERRVGITALRHQETKERTLRLLLWYPNNAPVEPEMVAALRDWEQLRPISGNQRAAVGQMSKSLIFIDIAWANDLQPPSQRSKWRLTPDLTPDEQRRQDAVCDRLRQLELWLFQWYQSRDCRSSLVVTHHYPEYASRHITP
jgi:hypothetical protein